MTTHYTREKSVYSLCVPARVFGKPLGKNTFARARRAEKSTETKHVHRGNALGFANKFNQIILFLTTYENI